MPNISEGSLVFSFSHECCVIKYDANNSFYKTTVERCPISLKAIDILLKENDETITLFEIKDCFGNELENQPRFSGIDSQEIIETKEWLKNKKWDNLVSIKRAKPYLPDEVAQKVIDTFTGLITSQRHAEPTLLNFYSAFTTPRLNIVLFLTLNYTPKDYNRLASRLGQTIRTRLSFLRINQVIICNEQTIPTNSTWSVTRI